MVSNEKFMKQYEFIYLTTLDESSKPSESFKGTFPFK